MFSANFAEMTTSTPFRDLLHAANIRHGTDGFTSPPKEGVLRIFSPLKIRRRRLGLNPRTWVLKASTLPLDHRSPLLMLTAIKYHQGNGKKKNSIKAATRRKYGYEKQCSTGHKCIQLEMVMNITVFLFTLTVLFESIGNAHEISYLCF